MPLAAPPAEPPRQRPEPPPRAASAESQQASAPIVTSEPVAPPDRVGGPEPSRPAQNNRIADAPTGPPTGEAIPGRLNGGPRGAENGHLMGSIGCTAPQLRRFIKSRPYVPMHELRRRFGIDGDEDDVTAVELSGGRIFVGLPAREGGLLGELMRGGEVGFELSLDPRSPIVVGLYPMRPVPRP
jgi:hypothetical protein